MKRVWLIAIVVIVFLCAWLVFPSDGPKEPSYQGRTLTQWLTAYQFELDVVKMPPDVEKRRLESAQAVHAIGTNAIPTLLFWLRAKDSPMKMKLIALAQRQSIVNFRFSRDIDKHAMAVSGFWILKKEAQPAIPELIRLGNDPTNENPDTAWYCVFCIDPKEADKIDLKLTR